MRSAFYNLINFINTAKVDDVYANAAKRYQKILIKYQS